MKKILEIGAGKNPVKISDKTEFKVVRLDKFPIDGIDVVHDLESLPLPFKNDEFDVVHAHHVLEHIRDFFEVVDEIYRILKPGGRLIMSIPHYSSNFAFVNPDHKRFFAYDFWKYFTDEIPENYYTKARFKPARVRFNFVRAGILRFLNPMVNPIINLRPYFTEKFFPFAVDEIRAEFEAIK